MVDDEDKAQNDQAVLNGLCVRSAYDTRLGERVWVITEADRAVTTLRRPVEY